MFSIGTRCIYILTLLTLSIQTLNALRKCSFDKHCKSNEYCCVANMISRIKLCRLSCVGELCRSKKDCGSENECCSLSGRCTVNKKECDCRRNNKKCHSEGLYCCEQKTYNEESTCRSNCIGETCFVDKDCAPGECCNENKTCTRDMNSCLKTCNVNSDCVQNKFQPYCCGRRLYQRYCSNTCLQWLCSSDGDCGEAGSCCVNNYCINSGCINGLSSLKLVTILTCTIGFLVVSIVILIICYCKKGQCILFRSRNNDDNNGLNSPDTSSPEECHIIPPPPYSVSDKPFPRSQNQEFPPLYEEQPT